MKKFNGVYEKLCFLDLETTGRYWNSDAPIQVAAIICDREGNVLDKYVEKIKTTHKINAEASKVHGIYESDLVNCRSEKTVLNDFIAWLINWKADVIITYNGEAFDRPMLNKRCEVLGIKTTYFDKTKFPGIDGYYDCVYLAKKKNLWSLADKLGRKWNLVLVANTLGFDTAGAHDAYKDICMLKEVFYKVDPEVHPERWGGEESIKKIRSLLDN